MKAAQRKKVIASLHSSRMRPYLDAALQNEVKALSFYQWNMQVTAAVQAVLGVTEVILRNAVDRELQLWNAAQQQGGPSWLLSDPAAPLRSLTAGKRIEAKGRADKERDARDAAHLRYGAPITHDDVLAQVMFGMWKDLLPNHHPGANPSGPENLNRAFLWRNAIEKAFPNVNDPDGSVTYWRVAHLHQLRNRVSHMEPLLNVNVADRVREAFDLVRSIDLDVANWVTGGAGSQVAAVLKLRPQA